MICCGSYNDNTKNTAALTTNYDNKRKENKSNNSRVSLI